MIRRGKGIWLFVLALAWTSSIFGQQTPGKPTTAAEPEYLREYRIGGGDILAVQVFGLPQLDQTARVSTSGKIHIPYVGVLPTANMSVGEIENKIAEELKNSKLVKDPWVHVRVVEYNAQPVFVVGQVNSPGQYMITGGMSLLDVISKAKGLKESAADEAYLIRRRPSTAPGTESGRPDAAPTNGANEPASSTGERIPIDLAQLTEGNRPDLNLRLQGGDVFYVPTRPEQLVYIMGEVKYPGAYVLPKVYDHITVSRALAYAGGATRRTAKTSKVVIVRLDEKGSTQPLSFDIAKIIKGEQPDIQLRPNDVLFVPRSVAKMTGYKFLDMVAHMTHQAVIF